MTDDSKPTETKPGNGRKPRQAKPKASGAKANRDSVAALKVVTLNGIPVKDGRSARSEDARAKALEHGEPVGHRLTAKQESFARHVASGSTLTDAYKQSYDCSNMKPDSVNQLACKLNANVKVASAIAALKESMRPRAQHDPGEVKAKIIQALLGIMTNPASKPADIARAAELLGKWSEVALFEERSVIKTETISVDDAATQLAERIAKLKAG